MKKMIILLTCAAGMLCLSTCTSSSDKLVIKGSLTGLQAGDTIVVHIYDFERQLVAGDTIAVTKKSHFYFERLLNQLPYSANLYYFPADTALRRHSKTLDLSSTSDKLVLQGDAAEFTYAPVVSGGFYDNKIVKAYVHVVDSLYKAVMAASDSMREASLQRNAAAEKKFDEEFSRLAGLLEVEEMTFIKNHPDVMYAAYLYVSTSRWETLKNVQEQYDAFTPELQQSIYGEMIKKNIDKRATVAAGAQLPEFTVVDVDGKAISSADFRGSYLLLDFWGSWCSWCRKASPKLVKLYSEYKNKNLRMLGLAWDQNHESWKKAIQKDGMTWRHANLYDHQALKDLFYISAFPTYIFVSPEGVILANSSDFDKEVEPILRKELK
jgi:thiol-disulfide isomerase/thioredoxin